MANVWLNDSGILRKNKPCETEDLLVFGYSCKLFRDDEKALSVDQGKHLIPWMGDETLKIDRYDGRGALYDLASYEAAGGGFHPNWTGLSEDERRAEQLCDEERYWSLYHNEVEEEMYKEEQLKRLHQQHATTYGQVSYNYETFSTADADTDELNEVTPDKDDEAFVPPAYLDLPINMVLPETAKLNAIIEKTARFISEQGAQMEILLKAKQKDNPQFEFMNHDCPLYQYYRHIMMAMKTGRYKPPEPEIPPEPPAIPETDTSFEDLTEASHYLHPSLAATTAKVELAPTITSIPTLTYKPSVDCAYSMLVHKIKGTTPAPEPQPPLPTTPAPDATYYDPNAYYNPESYPYYDEQYREYYMQYYMAHYGLQSSEIAKAPVMYNIGASESKLPEPIVTESVESKSPVIIGPQIPPDDQIFKAAVEEKPLIKAEEKKENLKTHHVGQNEAIVKKLSVGLQLAQYYNTDSESDTDEVDEKSVVMSTSVVKREKSPELIVPPQDTKVIIHKMASYVAKNGREFETIVKSKGDPRFAFLSSEHMYYGYYLHKVNEYTNHDQLADTAKENTCAESSEVKEEQKVVAEKPKQKVIGPVSFSIKKPKESEPIPTKPGLPMEESSDEETEATTNTTEPVQNGSVAVPVVTEAVARSPSLVPTVTENVEEIQTDPPKIVEQKIEPNIIETIKTNEISTGTSRANSEAGSDVEAVRQVVEVDEDLIDLTDDLEDKLDAKRAPVTQVSREKQLQIDRKKRAAAFLIQLKTKDTIVTTTDVDQKPSETEGQPFTCNDTDSSDSNYSLIERLDELRAQSVIENCDGKTSGSSERKRKSEGDSHRKHKKKRSRRRSGASDDSSPQRHRDEQRKHKKSKKKSHFRDSKKHKSKKHSRPCNDD